jgi:hypothetical protein
MTDLLLERLRVGTESYFTCSRAFIVTLVGAPEPLGGPVDTVGGLLSQDFTQFHLESPFSGAIQTNGSAVKVEDSSDWIVLLLQLILIHICAVGGVGGIFGSPWLDVI